MENKKEGFGEKVAVGIVTGVAVAAISAIVLPAVAATVGGSAIAGLVARKWW